MSGIGTIRRVQTHISDHVVWTSIAVEVCCGDPGPPAGSCFREARRFGVILEAASLAIAKVFYMSPLQSEQEIDPTITIDIAPQCGRDHSDIQEVGSERLGHILELTAPIHEERTGRSKRILS